MSVHHQGEYPSEGVGLEESSHRMVGLPSFSVKILSGVDQSDSGISNFVLSEAVLIDFCLQR